EDGIRDFHVTGVQTCALPICSEQEGIPIFSGLDGNVVRAPRIDQTVAYSTVAAASGQTIVLSGLMTKETFDIHRRVPLLADIPRSEERRVGKGGGDRWLRGHW